MGSERCGDGDVRATASGFRGSGEYLLWWFENGRVPPLVTAGGDGVPDSRGTRVLLDDLDFDGDARHGGRFVLSYQFETTRSIGVEPIFFFLSDRQSDVSFSSSGDPVLGRPFINVATGMPDATLVAAPGIAAGSVTVAARAWLWGVEANLTASLKCSNTFRLTALGGFRFVTLEDDLGIGEDFQVAPDVPRFGGSTVGLQDEFRTVNRFYGAQVGLQTGVRLGLLTIDARGKIAVGPMRQVADIDGATNVLAPDGQRPSFREACWP